MDNEASALGKVATSEDRFVAKITPDWDSLNDTSRSGDHEVPGTLQPVNYLVRRELFAFIFTPPLPLLGSTND